MNLISKYYTSRKSETQFIFLILVFYSFSCQTTPKRIKLALDLAGENKTELVKVIEHYKDENNSLKLKASYFLIENMISQYYEEYDLLEENFIEEVSNKVFQSKDKSFYIKPWFTNYYDTERKYKNKINNIWDSISNTLPTRPKEIKNDLKEVNSALLINNIEFAFSAWETAPWYKQIDFDKFCQYILPYRSLNEIPANNRKHLYKSALQYKDNSILETAKNINAHISKYFIYSYPFENFSHMRLEDILKTRSIVCRHHNSVKLAYLRALGIPAYTVFAVDGTSWVAFEDENGEVYNWEWIYISENYFGSSIEKKRAEKYGKIYSISFKNCQNDFMGLSMNSIPNLFRHRNIIDVTEKFIDCENVTIDITNKSPNNSNFIYLCIFNRSKLTWEAIDWTYDKKNKAYFNYIGREKIYLPAFYHNNHYIPAADPFYVDNNGIIKKFVPGHMSKIRLFKKDDWNYLERYNALLTVGMWIEGDNNRNFSNPEVLSIVKDIPISYGKLKINSEQDFRYFRFISLDTTQITYMDRPTGIHLSELEFISNLGVKITGMPISEEVEQIKFVNNLFDDDIRTNFDIYDKPGWVGIDAGKRIKLSQVNYLIRNSFNIIEPGDKYQLFYWDKKWISLEIKIASERYIDFEAPVNSVVSVR